MDDPKKRNILFAVVVTAALGLIGLMGFGGGGVAIVTDVLPSTTVEGEVLSVDPPSPSGASTAQERYAVVKLSDGKTVRASVGSCVVFPGQTTRLARFGAGPVAFYIVTQ